MTHRHYLEIESQKLAEANAKASPVTSPSINVPVAPPIDYKNDREKIASALFTIGFSIFMLSLATGALICSASILFSWASRFLSGGASLLR